MRDLTSDPTSDEAAIRDMIAEETNASNALDFERWTKCFVHDDRTTEISFSAHRGMIVHKGWDAVSSAMRLMMDATPEQKGYHETITAMRVTVSGDMAWVTYHSVVRDKPEVPPKAEFEQIRILEREAGQWRIVYLGFAAPRTLPQKTVIQIDRNAHVLWASQASLDALDNFEGLKIVGNRLVASDRLMQDGLSRAIIRIADVCLVPDGGCLGPMDETFHFPCLLGQDADGGVLHCTVFAWDGSINVSFNDPDQMAAKVAAAREVFFLSDTQARLANEILDGRSLSEIATMWDVSPNTVRTHLARVFEKTGVSSQQALVRLMLSLHTLPE